MLTPENTITVNGELRTVAEGSTLADLVQQLGVPPERLAIELNRGIVRRDQWRVTTVENGAQIEIVQFVGGG
jgi:sulfur carrier protein